MGFRGCVPRWLLGLVWELVGASLGLSSDSPPTYENSPLPSLWCNRFLGLLAKSRFKGILRGFIWVYRVQDVYLVGCGALRGLCGFCAREVFGG